ncbi:acid phosphatase [Cohnella sp. CFH 77786]|uniref:alkaline phosphatase family protein n=1 Tax=Cohnella sp. CFH 77786 TaxID=2662265 RepID=UPI001ED60357|nr:alkaline phosphatase family protein [Cohnella sp. CFH 77786]MBW5446300.1 acid phosphatase [Cohnella sp. CFH 77786]
MKIYIRIVSMVAITVSVLASCTSAGGEALTAPDAPQAAPAPVSAKTTPKPDKVVIVIEENHSFKQIYHNPDAPYMNELMKKGANLVNHYAVEHPSQPNYYDLFSGSNQGIKDDKRPKKKSGAPNLASELIKRGYTFGGYSESLPKTGFDGSYDSAFKYARKHNPWVNFTNVPSAANMPFDSFPQDFARLPTVSIVVPNLDHDIHDGTVKQADDWLKKNLSPYVEWAEKHNGLFLLTWDEDDYGSKNKIPTIFVGPMVKQGTYAQKSNHFSVLRTIEDLYGLPALGESRKAKALDIWKA